MSAHIEWLAARETSVQVFTPGEDWVGAGAHRQPVLTLAGDDVVAIQGTPAELRALAARIRAVSSGRGAFSGLGPVIVDGDLLIVIGGPGTPLTEGQADGWIRHVAGADRQLRRVCHTPPLKVTGVARGWHANAQRDAYASLCPPACEPSTMLGATLICTPIARPGSAA